MYRLLLGLTLLPLLDVSSSAAEKTLTVDFAAHALPLDHDLWCSSGEDQGRMTKAFEQDMQQVGSVPYGGCRWMRPHYLLDLVEASGLDTEHPSYTWTNLDHTLDTMLAAELTPIFELMGNPSKHFTSFLDRAQLMAWRRMITDLTLHMQQRYGAKVVRSWLFESWNEPDAGHADWTWHTPAEHNNYYDACSEGLKAADPALRFGGPGVSRHAMPYGTFLRTFLDHCDTGTNYFTGEKGVRVDFISYHYKNKPAAMVDVEVDTINQLLRDHPRFASTPIFNDEADSEVQWNKPYPYRGTPWYAAFIARSLNEHLFRIVDGGSIAGGRKLTNYRLSNDDAFWGPWPFRGQLAQFGTDAQFAFVKKPAHIVRSALALLGDRRVPVEGFALNDPVGAIATLRRNEAAVIVVYNYRDQTEETGTTRVTLELQHLPFAHAKWIHYRIDADHGDTHRQWQALGSPEKPTDEQIQTLRQHQELGTVEAIVDVEGATASRTFDLPLPGVSLIMLVQDGDPRRETIGGLYAQVYPSLSGQHEDVMLKWNGLDRLVKTYVVLQRASRGGGFARVNASDQIETGFVLQRSPGENSDVKIQALDYSDRVIGESEVLALPAKE
jgi:L-iduronidase